MPGMFLILELSWNQIASWLKSFWDIWESLEIVITGKLQWAEAIQIQTLQMVLKSQPAETALPFIFCARGGQNRLQLQLGANLLSIVYDTQNMLNSHEQKL